jgi:SAM-dependent methyltransferase
MIYRDSKEIGPATIMHHAYAVYPSFAMLAGMQLDVFTPLKDGALSAESLARALGVQPMKLSPLLYALVTADLLTVAEGVFANTEEADKFLVRGRIDYLGGLSGFYSTLWHATLQTAESIRTGQPQAKHEWKSLPEEELVRFFSSQYPDSLRAGRQLAQKLDFAGFKHLLDAGGGSGGLSIGICETCRELRATVADLPTVVSISERFIAEAGMSHRIKTTAADLVDGPPSGTYDVAVLRALLQVMPPGKVRKVLRNIAKAMKSGSSLFIVGSILDDSRQSPPASLAFSLVSLSVYDDGHAYTAKEHRDWLLEAGFTDISVEYEAFSDGLGVVSARKA